jgi:stress response protein SCP2
MKKLANTNIDISQDAKYDGKVSMVFAALENKNNNWEYRMIAEPTDKRTLQDLVSICASI